jgi:hypothetical protein
MINLKNIKIKPPNIKTLFFFIALNLYLILTGDLFNRFIQLTPDTYRYIFIARSMNSPDGVTDIFQATLLLRGLNLPLLLAIFEGEYVSSILPSVIVILNLLALFGFCKEYGILKNKRNYLEFLIVSLLFLTTLQGFYLIFYITTHGIISLAILLYFGTLVKYRLSKEKITFQDHLILYSSLMTFLFIRPEGIIFSLLMIIFAFQYLNLSLRFLRFYLYTILILIIYWFVTLNLLEDTFRTRIAITAFSVLLLLSIIFIEYICERNFAYAFKLLNGTLIVICAISIVVQIRLLAKSIPACFELGFLNAGGLALVPSLMILSYLYIIAKDKSSNRLLMQVSLSGIAITHLLIPILNENQWLCGYAGWGETIARSYIHFMLLFGLGYLLSRNKLVEHI